MKKPVIGILILFFSCTYFSNAQLAAGYNSDGNTLSISTNPLHKLWGEFRVNTKAYNQAGWSYNDRGITQAYILTPVFTSKNASLYAGGGLGVNFLSEGEDKWLSINIPVGIRVNPFTSLPDLFITGEYNPMMVTSDGIPVIHTVSLGFRYVFTRKE